MNKAIFDNLLANEISQMCQLAIKEDLTGENNTDITAELIPAHTKATGTLITREVGIFCGREWLDNVYDLLGNKVNIDWLIKDGDSMLANQTLCRLQGDARSLLTGERSAINFLQTLSATATVTHQYVEAMNSSSCQLLDTRKTIPGMRFAQKYAVVCGGGGNHRLGLTDAYLIKENHIIACGDIEAALSKAKVTYPDRLLEIEVENLDELRQAIFGKADVIMLDNFNLNDLKKSVIICRESNSMTKLEASGNVNLNTIKDIADTGVDFISVGAITKNIQAIDLSMRLDFI